MPPDRHSMTEMHRSTNDLTGANITAGKVPVADGSGGVTWDDAGAVSGGGGFDVTPPQTVPLPAWVKPTGTGAITADPQGRITVDSNTEYKAFPGMTLHEGVLHAVWREGTAHNSDTGLLKYKRSLDLGRTWSSATTLVTPAGDLDVRDPNIVGLSSGRLLVTYDLREYDTAPDEIFAYRIYSDNRGQSWSSSAAIPMSFSGQEIVSGQAVEMPNGEILLPVFGDNGSFYIAACLFSTDDGDTFGDQTTIATGTHDWEEPVVRYLSTGNTVALIRDSAGTVTYRVVSTDGGHTWGSPASVLTASGRPDFVEFYPGALFLSARGASPDFAARWWVSWDEGATWTSAQEVDSGETDEQEYSAPVVVAPGYVALLYCIEDGSDAHVYLRYYRDGFGTDPIGNGSFADVAVADDLTVGDDATITGSLTVGGTEIDPTGAATGEALVFNGTKFEPAAVSSGIGDHEHMIDVFNGDASTTVFEISDEPLDPEAVFAFVSGSWTAITVSGAMNTTITFGSAPGSGTGNVVVQYPAVSV